MTDLSATVNSPGVTGMAYDNADGILYISTLSGELLRYDAKAGTFLSAIYLGGDLSSVAVSPDGSFLLVGDQDVTTDGQGNAYATIDRVQVSTSAVDRLSIPISNWSGYEFAGISSVAITSAGQAYATSSSQDWQFSAAATNPNFQTSPASPILSTTDEGRYLIQSDPLEITDTSENKTAGPINPNNTVISVDVNDVTGQVALLQYYNTLEILNSSLSSGTDITNISPGIPGDYLSGIHFSSDGKSLFILDQTQDAVLVYSTSSWTETSSISLPNGALALDTPEAMATSSDGRFLFVQTTSGIDSIDLTKGVVTQVSGGVDGAAGGIDARTSDSGTVGIDAISSGSGGIISIGEINTSPPTTIDVTGDYVVSSGQSLVLNETQSPAFTLIGQSGQPDPNLTIEGSVNLSSAVAEADLQGVADNGGSEFSHSLITIAKGGSLVVDASGANSTAYGYDSGDWAAGIENDGLLSVTAAGTAVGASMYEDAKFTNTGTFSVTGDSAIGVESGYPGTYVNTGQMTITGQASAVALEIGYFEGGSVTNNGTITVSANAGEPSIGISVTGLYELTDPLVITNTGTITAETAILEQNGSSPAETPLTFLNNSGTINGDIDLGPGYPVEFQPNGGEGSQITNTGTINGDIHFDNGNILYEGAQGHLTGAIYLGSGTDRVVLGDDGETVYGGSGYDDIVGGAGNDVINGGTGQTTFSYESATSAVTVSLAISGPQDTGGAGTDTLVDVNDLVGSAYNDTLTASGSHQTLEGGAGNDTLIAGVGDEVLDGGAGTDTVVLPGSASGYTVTQTGDYYEAVGPNGTYELYNDEILQFADEQMVLGSSGQTLIARAGGDSLIGGTGADTFIIGTGNDTVTGGGGTNTVVFSGDYSAYQIGMDNGVLTVVGPTGTDSLTDATTLQFADQTINVSSLGSLGQLIIGTSGNDTLTAGSTGATIYGLAGNDTLKGGAGADILDGGPGNDILNGGGGINTATYADATSGVTVSLLLTTAQNTGGSGTDTLTNIQNLIGSAYNDVLTAGKSGSVLQGMAGDDTLVSGPGNDTLDGGTGNNTASYALATSAMTVSLEISGAQNTIGAGKDTLINIQNLIGSNYNDTLTAGPNGSSLEGGAGNDTLVTGPGTDVLDGGTGTNTAVFSGHAADYTISQTGSATLVTGDGTSATLTNIQVLQFADEQMVLGTAGQSITARAAGDTLIGGPGNDTLKGGAGADILDGGPGNDILNGGGGINTATYADATSGVTVNLKLTTAQNTGGAGTDTLTNIQNLIGSAYNDTLTASGSGSVLQGMAGDDTLVSGPGNDTLDGGTGNNTASYTLAASAVTVSLEISGQQNTVGAGKDTLVNIQNLIGSNYNDTLTAGPNGSSLEGGAGNDTLITGPGTDVLDGGTGTNTAVFSGHAADYSISQNGSATLVTGDGTSATLTNIQVLQFADEQMVLGTARQSLTARAAGDTLVGGPGNDVLKGGAGDDTLIGNGGNDTINGGAGTNTAVFSGDAASYTVKESGGTTTVKGPDGTDTLTNVQVLQFGDSEMIGVSTGGTMTARAGGDSLIGGSGNDTLITGSGTDVLNGGAGVDKAVFAGNAADYAISQSGSATLVTGDGTSASLTNIEILQFANEQVVISATGQSLVARAAGDTLVGGAGNDSLKGTAGNDVLIGNGGNDTLNGGGGTNTAVFSGDYSSYKLSPASGTVTQVKGPDGTDTLANIQILQFADRQMVNGSTGETLTARPGGDTLVGGAGNDHLIGGAGNDTLIAGTGQDTLTGGGGQDTFVFSSIADSKVSAPDLITDWTPGDTINLSAIDANTAQAGIQEFHFGATAGHTGDIVVSYDAIHNRTVIDLYDSTSAKPEAEIWLAGNQTLSSSDFIL
jgi:Ca2+-binding RTX toxin-like protein